MQVAALPSPATSRALPQRRWCAGTLHDAAIPNRFELTLAATNRARQISAGSQPLVESDRDKTTVIALREIAAGKVGHEVLKRNAMTTSTLP